LVGIHLFLVGMPERGLACRRRLANIFPEGKPRNPTETLLLGISQDLESCLEVGEGTREAREARLTKALERWRIFYRDSRTSPPTPELDTPDYTLVLGSIQGYMRRIGKLKGSARRAQEVAVQHVFGELYGVLPGRARPLDVIIYTAQTLGDLPPPRGKSLEDWRVRLELLHRRTRRWLETASSAVHQLASLKPALASLESIREGLDQLHLKVQTAGAQADAASYLDRFDQDRKHLLKNLFALPEEAFQLTWLRRAAPPQAITTSP
jgi:hypothetical protein